MPEIRLVKKYPHIKDEDVISIFQEGYVKGFENGRKGAIPIEWIDGYIKRRVKVAGLYAEMLYISDMLKEWEKENETN